MKPERVYRVVVDRPGAEERMTGWDGGSIFEHFDVPSWTSKRYLTARRATEAVARIRDAGGEARIVASDPVTWPWPGGTA